MLIARTKEALESLAKELAAAGSSVHVLTVDLTRAEAGELISRALTERNLYCDVLINNAGICVAGATVDLGRAKQMELLALNVRALTELALRFMPGMITRRRGGILNVSSLGAYVAIPNMAIYCASKAFVASLSEALSCEVEGTDVTISCLRPGKVQTPLRERLSLRTGTLCKLLPASSADGVAEIALHGLRAGSTTIFVDWKHRAIAQLSWMLPIRLFRCCT